MHKVLVIRFSSIGDIVLTTPVLRCLKKSGATVHVATKAGFKGILESNPYVDKVHVLGEKLDDLVQELRAEKFDFVADLHNNLRSNIIRWKLGVKSEAFDKLNLRKWWLVLTKNRSVMPNVHIVQRYLKTIESLNISDDGEGLDYFIPPKDTVALDTLPAGFQSGYVAFAIGAQHSTKRLPTHRIVEAVQLIQAPVILLGGKEDRETGEKILAELLARKFPTYNACGLYNLHQSASLVEQSSAVVSHDTGLMHIAAALKKKTWSIWGNTVPELGMYPYKTEHRILENNNLSCRPCSKLGYNSCPKKHFDCMEKLDLSALQEIRLT